MAAASASFRICGHPGHGQGQLFRGGLQPNWNWLAAIIPAWLAARGRSEVARVVEKLSGSSYEDYTTSQIFAPCGITGILRPQIGERTRAERKFMEVAYYDNHTFPQDPAIIHPRRMDGAGGWIGRPSDLLLLARRVDGDPTHTDIINAASLINLRERGNPSTSSGSDWQELVLPANAPKRFVRFQYDVH